MAHHDHDEGTRNERSDAPSDRPQVAALGDLHDYEVADGYPDVRGWSVKLADGRSVGKVHELIVDTGSMRTRYLDVRLDRDLSGSGGERDVLVPIGTARLDGRGDNVLVDGLSADRIAALPAYEHGALTREHENTVRQHFGAAATDAGADTDYYAHDHFDDSRFYGDRGTTGSTSGMTGSGSGATTGSRADGEVPLSVSREGAIARRADGTGGTSGTSGSTGTEGSVGGASSTGGSTTDAGDRRF